MKDMKKYYLGLLVLGFLTLGLLVFTLTQASSAKQDSLTSKAVNDIGDKLNNYTANGNVPDELSQAGIKNVPSTISYTKNNESEYKICIKYNNASSMFDAGWTGMMGQTLVPGGGQSPYPGSSGTQAAFDTSVTFYHKKGENCQTVQPGMYNLLQNQDLQKTDTTTTGA